MDNIEPPTEAPSFRHTYHQYTVRIGNGKRDSIFESLSNSKIGCAIYYKIPLHRQPAYGGRFSEVKLPETERAAEEVLSLPIFPEMTIDERNAVIAAVKKELGDRD